MIKGLQKVAERGEQPELAKSSSESDSESVQKKVKKRKVVGAGSSVPDLAKASPSGAGASPHAKSKQKGGFQGCRVNEDQGIGEHPH